MTPDYDVFLSHAGEDRAIALQLKRELESVYKLRVWVFEENKSPGSYRTGPQEQVLLDGAAFVILVSAEAAAKREVRHEADRAFSMGRAFIPVFMNEAITRDERVKGQLLVGAQNGTVLPDGVLRAEHVKRVYEIVRDDLKSRKTDVHPRLSSGRLAIGRSGFLDQLQTEMGLPGFRGMILYGPPGSGKSTLAKALVERLNEVEVPTECVFLQKDDKTFKEVVTRIQNALNLEADAGASAKIILSALAARVRSSRGMVLLIDNFEQVDRAAREQLLGELAAIHTPALRIIITTRIRFDTTVLELVEHKVEPLSYPSESAIDLLPASELCQRFPAVELFYRYAITPVQGHRDLELARSMNREVVQDICRLCAAHEGFPGAVEVAAKTFAQLGGLKRQLSTVTACRKLRSDSIETMSVAVRSTFELLDRKLQSAFLFCGGFEAGFDDDAADAVLAHDGTPAHGLLTSLRDYGLLRRDADNQRWWMYLPILECARELGAEPKNRLLGDQFAIRHSEYFGDLAREYGKCNAPSELTTFHKRLDFDRENLISAIRRSLATNNPIRSAELLIATAESFRSRGPASTLLNLATEVDRALDLAIEIDSGLKQQLHAEVNQIAARAAESLGRYDEFFDRAKEAYERAHNASQTLRNRVISTYIKAADIKGQQEIVQHLFGELQDVIKSGTQTSGDEICEALIEATYVRERTEGRVAAEQMILRAIELAKHDPNVSRVNRWRVSSAHGLLLWRDGLTRDAMARFQDGLRLIDMLALGDVFRGGTYTNIALAAVDQNDFDLSADSCKRGREAFLRVDEKGWLTVNYVAEAFARLFIGMRPKSIEADKIDAARDTLAFLARHDEQIRTVGYKQNMALATSIRGEALFWLDQRDEAEVALLESRRWCREAEIPTFERWFRISVMLASISADRFDQTATAGFLQDASEFIQKRGLSTREHPVARTASMIKQYQSLSKRVASSPTTV